MFDLDGNDNYNSGNGGNNNSYNNNNGSNGYNNSGYNNNNGSNGYNNSGYNNNYNSNNYNNSGYNNNYSSNNYNNSGYNNNYNSNNYNNSGYNNNYSSNNSYGSSSYSSTPARSGNAGSSRFMLLILAVAALLFLAASFGTNIVKLKNCRSMTRGTVVSVTQTKERVRKKNSSTTRYRYRYKAKVVYEVDNEQFTLDVPKTSYKFRQGQTEIVYYNESDPSESYSDSYMDQKKTSALGTVGLIVLLGLFSLFTKNKRQT